MHLKKVIVVFSLKYTAPSVKSDNLNQPCFDRAKSVLECVLECMPACVGRTTNESLIGLVRRMRISSLSTKEQINKAGRLTAG